VHVGERDVVREALIIDVADRDRGRHLVSLAGPAPLRQCRA
jgi:hypothetical protein